MATETAGYVDKHLLPDERVLYRARVAPVAAFGPAVVGMFSIGLGCVLLVTSGIAAATSLLVLGVVIELFAVPAGLVRLRFNEFALTDRRVLAKTGMVRQISSEILLRKVEGIGVHQSIPGRLFGYGSVTVTGTGGSRDPFRAIDRPFDFRTAVQHQIEQVNALAP